METENIFYLGDIVSVLDQIDLATETTATVRAVEQDNEIEGLFWVYLVANDESLNTNFEPNIGNYWIVRENTNPYLTIISRAI